MTVTLQDLKPSQIKPHKANPRRDVGDVTELAESLKAKGVVEPLIVTPNGTGDTYTLLAGHRRHAAAKLAKLKTVPCLVREDLAQDPKGQVELMLVENLQRTDLSPVEEAEAYQQLLTFPGYTMQKIADATGRAVATVRGRVAMAKKLPKNALQKVHEGQISLTEASALSDFAGDKRFGQLERLAGTDQFPRALKDAQGARTRERKVASLTKTLKAEGVRIIDAPTWQTKVIRLFGDDGVEAHRGCEGFAAYVESSQWSPPAVSVKYVCDKPELHADDDTGEQDDPDHAARQAAYDERQRLLAQDATCRRAWLRDHVLGDPSDGLAVDVLRQRVHRSLANPSEWLSDVLGVVHGDKKALSRRIDELTWQQLAIVVDFDHHEYDERALERDHGWENGNYNSTKDWRTRLTGLYGYTWTEHEQQLIDEAATATSKPSEVDGDDDDAADFDDNPDWADDE